MQGFNKYYPPDFDPEAGGLNKLHGKHALGDRARKLDQGVLIVRFEMPYNIWCGGCDNHIGMGVRYNAEKKKVGMYYTTPIYSFRCKCHLCQSWFEIRTDPQNTRYVVHSGARQKNEEWDPEENGGIVIADKLSETADAFEVLERTTTQKTVAMSAAKHLDVLESLQHDRWSDPYAASSLLRSSFRKDKKVRLESEGKAEVIREKYGLGTRVSVEALRTPGVELRREEDREWGEARREKDRREEVRKGKRRSLADQVGWKEEKAETRRSLSSRSGGAPSSSSRRRLSEPTSSSTTRTRQSPHPSTSSPAVKSLAAQVLLNSAVKSDPFRGGTGLERSTSRKGGGDGLVGVVRREVGVDLVRRGAGTGL